MAQQKPGPRQAKQANSYLHDRTTPAVRPMRPSRVWTPAPRRYGTPQRTHLGNVEKTPVFDRADLAPIMIRAAGRLEPPVTAAIVSLAATGGDHVSLARFYGR